MGRQRKRGREKRKYEVKVKERRKGWGQAKRYEKREWEMKGKDKRKEGIEKLWGKRMGSEGSRERKKERVGRPRRKLERGKQVEVNERRGNRE